MSSTPAQAGSLPRQLPEILHPYCRVFGSPQPDDARRRGAPPARKDVPGPQWSGVMIPFESEIVLRASGKVNPGPVAESEPI